MKNTDEIAIEALVQTFIDGWNAADGDLCARPFAEDADFTAVTGVHIRGRGLIAQGHKEILATVFRGTTNSATVDEILFLRPDVAVANVTFRFVGEPNPLKGSKASCGMVCTKDNGQWSIAVFRNMVPFERPAAGPLERKLMAAN